MPDNEDSEESVSRKPWKVDESSDDESQGRDRSNTGVQNDTVDSAKASIEDHNPTSSVQSSDRGAVDQANQQNTSSGSSQTDVPDDVPSHVYPDYTEYKDDTEREPEHSLFAKLLLFVVGAFKRLLHLKILGMHKIVPVLTGNTGKRSGLSGYFYPDHLIREDEQVLYSGHTSRLYSPGGYIFAAVLFILAVAISILVPLGYGQAILDSVSPSWWQADIPDNWWYAPLLMFAIGVLILIITVVRRASTWHIVTDKRVLYREGVASPYKKRIDFMNIESIENDIPFPDRLLGIGYINIYTASTGSNDAELVMKGVKHSQKKSALIDEARYEYIQNSRAQKAGVAPGMNGQPQVAGTNEQQSGVNDQQESSQHDYSGRRQQPSQNQFPQQQDSDQQRSNNRSRDPTSFE